jgi:integral membrane protein
MSLLKQLSTLAILEGISYLLFAVTMPLKYMLDLKWPNQIVGMIHGVLFIAYCLWVVLVAREQKWNIKTTLVALAASLLPIATFIVDIKIIKPEIERVKK